MNNKMIKIYIKGDYNYKLNLSGWSYLISDENDNIIKIEDDILKNITSPRIEIISLLEALKFISNNYSNFKDIEIISNNKNIIDSLEKWLDSWVNQNFKYNKNSDLWIQIYQLLQTYSNIKYIWLSKNEKNKNMEVIKSLSFKNSFNNFI